MEMVGFYREMQPEPQGVFRESIRDKVRSEAPYPTAEIKKYLESGYPVFDIMETTRDVIGGLFTVAGGSSLMSDGRFVWRADLPEYVDAYNLDLPGEFLSFAAEHEFSVPAASRETLLGISVEAGRALGFRVDTGAAPGGGA
ncbi:hypothetical protein ACIQK5_21860 [Streptomyces virginiae]|uniref:hypothetical protein n=1 Tax=Streptomyces TaxID=1883 RepID=UPI00136AFCEA|nr:hypothetical protein [Streptomyces sp. SID1046]MYV77441.1 hypothetical protein [Streptomyces sp. SID1046]